MNGNEMSSQQLDYHVRELRNRLKHVLIVFTVFGVLGFFASENLLTFMQNDLGIKVYGLTPYEVLNARLAASFLIGFLLSFPVIFYQMLKFAEPGLTRKEYRAVRDVIPFSYMLFLGGAYFSYEIVLKNALKFFQGYTASANVGSVWGLMNTALFGLQLSVLTGLMFQIPIISLILSRLGFLNSATMKQYRAHFIVGTLLVAAVATPPDVFTQAIITFPVLMLYELSVVLVSRF